MRIVQTRCWWIGWRAVLLHLALVPMAAWSGDLPLRVSVRPAPVYVEQTGTGQAVHCDFVVENRSAESWTVRAVEVSALDATGKLATRRFVNDNGNSPSIATLNQRTVQPGQRMLVFNPLYRFDPEVPLAELVFEFTWTTGADARELSTTVRVRPETYVAKTALRLPLEGPVIVWDGHDYYAHHRRFNYLGHEPATDGLNPDRYSYDFLPVNRAGDMREGDPAVNASWLGFGRPVLAAGAGRVVARVDDEPDNREVNEERFAKNRLADYGNYIIIDHGGGEFALYGHLRQGSARVSVGDAVGQGQPIAAIGASGSSLMPHLHFHLQSAPRADAEGLPSRFDGFLRLLGARSLAVARGYLDSGDIVEDAGINRTVPPAGK